jgi:hypothetical protein
MQWLIVFHAASMISDTRQTSGKGSFKGRCGLTRQSKQGEFWYRFIQSDGSDVSVAGGYRV